MGVIGVVGGAVDIGVDSVRFFFSGRLNRVAKGNLLVRAGLAVTAAVGKRVVSVKTQQLIVENAEKVSDTVDEFVIRQHSRQFRFLIRGVSAPADLAARLAGKGRVSDRILAGTIGDEAMIDAHFRKPKKRGLAHRALTHIVTKHISDKVADAAVRKAIEQATKGKRIRISK